MLGMTRNIEPLSAEVLVPAGGVPPPPAESTTAPVLSTRSTLSWLLEREIFVETSCAGVAKTLFGSVSW